MNINRTEGVQSKQTPGGQSPRLHSRRKSTCSQSEPREELKIKTLMMVTVTIALTPKTLPCKVKGHVLKLPSHSLPLNAPIIGHKETKL